MTDKPVPDFTMDDVYDLLIPERRDDIYDGPLAVTATDVQEEHGNIVLSAAGARCKRQVLLGKMVEVWVIRKLRGQRGEKKLRGYVPTQVYERWLEEREESDIEQESPEEA